MRKDNNVTKITMRMIIVIIFIVQMSSYSKANKTCTLIGKIINRTSDTLLLLKSSKFPIIEAKIPIVNNQFKYSFTFSQTEAFSLIFKEEFDRGYMNEVTFFSESGDVNFILHEYEKTDENIIKGNKYNNALIEYKQNLKELFFDEIYKYTDSLNLLSENGPILSEEWNKVQEQLRNTTNENKKKQLYNEQKYLRNTKEMFTPQARKIALIQDSIIKEMKLWEFNYIENNTSLLSFYKFIIHIRETAKSCCWEPVDKELIDKAQKNLDRFSLEFPNHPYITIVNNTLGSLKNIHEGGKFVDFEIPNQKGENIILSEIIIKNKLTLLDFWSTWCSPCIKTSREIVPVYEEFNGKGFEVLGITQNYREMDKLLKFIQKENYPWENVIDVDSKAGIWDKYGLSNSGGGTFLINSSGQIIGVNLTLEKIKEKIIEYLE